MVPAGQDGADEPSPASQAHNGHQPDPDTCAVHRHEQFELRVTEMLDSGEHEVGLIERIRRRRRACKLGPPPNVLRGQRPGVQPAD